MKGCLRFCLTATHAHPTPQPRPCHLLPLTNLRIMHSTLCYLNAERFTSAFIYLTYYFKQYSNILASALLCRGLFLFYLLFYNTVFLVFSPPRISDGSLYVRRWNLNSPSLQQRNDNKRSVSRLSLCMEVCLVHLDVHYLDVSLWYRSTRQGVGRLPFQGVRLSDLIWGTQSCVP